MQINVVTFFTKQQAFCSLFSFLFPLATAMQTTDSTGIDWCITFLKAFQVGIHFNIYLNSIKQRFQSLCKKVIIRVVIEGQVWEINVNLATFDWLPSAVPIEKWAPFPVQQKGNRKQIILPFPSHLPCVEDWGKEIFLNAKQLQSNLSNTDTQETDKLLF